MLVGYVYYIIQQDECVELLLSRPELAICVDRFVHLTSPNRLLFIYIRVLYILER